MSAAPLAVLAASLAGSLHCAGMCGPLVLFYAGSDGDPAAVRRGHLAYNLGRLAAYLALGAVAGALGAAVELTGALAGFAGATALVGGALVALWGVHGLLVAWGARLPRMTAPARWRALPARFASRLRGLPVAGRAGALGLLSGLLPCGWLWAFVAVAATTGSPAAGAGVTAAFWLGTVPALLGVGAASRLLSAPIRRRLPAVTAAILLLLGIAVVAGRAGRAGEIAAAPDACCHADR